MRGNSELGKPTAPGVTLASLVAVTYFMVSGGPYGLEELVADAGYSRAYLALMVTPLIWSLPTALMVGELSAALPHEGGYYAWVRRALGPFWGFQEAWLSLAASVFDMAIYPTLFADYLARFFPTLEGRAGIAAGGAMIAACALWNIAGSKVVGRSSLLLCFLMLAPFAIVVLLSGMRPAPLTLLPGKSAGLFAGVTVAMWNYMGWDNASTIASEVKRPQRTYPLAMILTVVLVALTYLLPVWAAQTAGLDPRGWSSGDWATAGGQIGGPWLGTAIVIGGVISAVGCFNSLVMSYSRIPAALAEDGMLPRVFARRAERTGAPWVAIVACSIAYAACLGLGFKRLVLIDVILYASSLVLEFVALVILRVREPHLPRPFRVPGGLPGAILVGLGPTALLIAALVTSINDAQRPLSLLTLALVLICAGPLLYRVRAPNLARAGMS